MRTCSKLSNSVTCISYDWVLSRLKHDHGHVAVVLPARLGRLNVMLADVSFVSFVQIHWQLAVYCGMWSSHRNLQLSREEW